MKRDDFDFSNGLRSAQGKSGLGLPIYMIEFIIKFKVVLKKTYLNGDKVWKIKKFGNGI